MIAINLSIELIGRILIPIICLIYALTLLKIYKKEKNKRKLLFFIAFLTTSISTLYPLLTYIGIQLGDIGYKFYIWTSLPILIAVFIAANDKIIKPKKYDNVLNFFILLTIICLSIPFIPMKSSLLISYIRMIVSLEIIFITTINLIKSKNIQYLYFLLGIISISIAGISILQNLIYLTLFSEIFAFVFFGLIFITTQSSENSIGSYFSLQEELLHTKSALIEKEDTFKILFNNLADPVMIIDKQGVFLELTDKVKEYTGYDKEEILGKNFLKTKLLTPKSKAICIKNLMKRMAGIDVKPYEVEARRKDGKIIPFEINAQKITYKGKPADLVLFRDISQRKKSEEKLRESEKRYRTLFDYSKDAIMTCEPPDWRFTSGNFAILDMFKVKSIDEFTKLTPMEVSPEFQPDGRKSSEKAVEMIQKAMDNGSNFFEWVHKRKNGEEFPATVLLNKITLENKSFLQATVRDITSRKRAEEKIKESEKALSDIIKGSPIPTFVIDKNNIVTHWNQSLEKLSRLSAEKVIGTKNHWKAFYDKKRPLIADLVVNGADEIKIKQYYGDKYKKSGFKEFHEAEDFFPHLGDNGKWLYFTASPITNDQGNITGSIEMLQDITERKQAEDMLKESEEQFRKISETANDAIIMMDPKGDIHFWNKAAENIFGYSNNEAIGKNSYLLLAPQKFKTDEKMTFSHFKTTGYKNVIGKTIEILGKTKNGETIPLELSLSSTHYHNQQYTIAIIRDISDRKKAEIKEKKLLNSSLFLSKTADELNHFSIEKNIYEYIGEKIFNISKNALIITSTYRPTTREYSVKQVYGMKGFLETIASLIKIDLNNLAGIINIEEFDGSLKQGKLVKISREGFKEFINQFLPVGSYTYAKKLLNLDQVFIMGLKAEGNTFGGVLIAAQKNTEIENVDVIETFINQAAVVIQKNSAMKDLADVNNFLEKKVEKRTERIELLLKQKDEFIHQLGHDLKNPLGPLVNLLPILNKHTTEQKDKEIIETLQRNVGYMKNLVQNTLELARLNSPNTNFSFKYANLYNIIEGVIKQNNYLFDKHDINVVNNIKDNTYINVDQLRIEELFHNIISNAVKYSSDHSIIKIDMKQEDAFAKISISDSGIGMTKDQLDHIFDEFYKADESRHDFHSTGLGMPICKRIVEKHGGQIWAESNGMGKGSTFYFTLPLISTNTKEETRDKGYDSVRNKVDEIISNIQ